MKKIYLLLFLVLLNFSCQTEDPFTAEEESAIQNHKPPTFTAKILSGDSVRSITTLIDSNLKDQHNQNKQSEHLYSSIYGFSIDTSRVQVIETSLYSSYTYILKKDEPTEELLTNYVATYFKSGKIHQYIIQYPILTVSGKNIYDVGNASILQIRDKSLLKVSGAETCSTVIEYKEEVCVDIKCKDDIHTVANGDECIHWGKMGMATRECSGGGYVENETCSSGGTSGGTNPYPDGGGSEPGTGTGTPDPDPDEEIVIPLGPTIYDEIDECINNPFDSSSFLGITDETKIDRAVIDNLEKTQLLTLKNYLDENACSEEAQGFAIQAALAFVANGEVDFEDKIIRDPAFLGNPCLNSVYNGLDVSDIASAFLSNFQGHNPVAHLNFSVGVDANYPNANAVTYAPDNFVISIKFNPNKLARPRTAVARTFIHEILHAEMYRKLLSMAQQGTIPWTAQFIHSLKNDFPGLSDYYTRWWLDTNGLSPTGPQHELMAQHYRSTISSFLMQFDPSLTQIQADALAWGGIMGSGQINNTTGLPAFPTVAWNNVPQQTRLNILSIIGNFNNNNPDCQS